MYMYMYIVLLIIIVSQENRESEIFTKKYQTETSARWLGDSDVNTAEATF